MLPAGYGLSARRLTLLLLAAGLFMLPLPAESGEEPFRIIVHKDNPVESLSEAEVAGIFLKKTTRWEDGSVIHPVDQPASSPVRRAFSMGMLQKTVHTVQAYWRQRIFAGRAVPPPEREGDAGVVAFVAQDPKAIGYVRPGAEHSGVKVLAVSLITMPR